MPARRPWSRGPEPSRIRRCDGGRSLPRPARASRSPAWESPSSSVGAARSIDRKRRRPQWARRPVPPRLPPVRWGAGGIRAPTPRSNAIPILMYHVVADPPPGAPYPELYVSRDAFAGQMAWLAEHGYRAVTLRAVRDHWQLGRPLPARPIVLTFDDGYHSQFAHALPDPPPPWLGRRARPGGEEHDAIVGVVAASGATSRHQRLGGRRPHADPPRPDTGRRRAAEAGGSRLAARSAPDARVPVEFFCYPAGRFDDRVVAAVKSAGYLGATTTIVRPGAPGRHVPARPRPGQPERRGRRPRPEVAGAATSCQISNRAAPPCTISHAGSLKGPARRLGGDGRRAETQSKTLTSRYSVSRCTGILPSDRIRWTSSSVDVRCEVPAAETTFSSIITEPMSSAPKPRAT